MFRKRLCSLFLVSLCLWFAPRGFAHPMGNFSVNHYSKISLEREGIRVSYIIDLAEIPTYQELQQGNVTANVADPAVTRFVASRGAEFARGLSVRVGGQPVSLQLLSSQVIFPSGAGGLPTMKMGFVYQAAYPPDRSSARLEYADNNYPGHAGWKEIVALGTAASLITSSVAQTDRSSELSNYPTDLLNSPPQDLSAVIQFRYPVALEGKATTGPSAPLRSGRDDKFVAKPAFPENKATAGPSAPLRSGRDDKFVAKPAFRENRATAGPSAPLQTNLHLQANQQATPRSAFTELRAGAWPRQDDCGRLPSRLAGHSTPCLSAGAHRHRLAYRGSICAGRHYALRLEIYRARTTVSLAGRILWLDDCRSRWIHVFAPLERS
jgi:hypothetical protein